MSARENLPASSLRDVSQAGIIKVLTRNADHASAPEAKLFIAVIATALEDWDVLWFASRDAEIIAERVGIDVEVMRSVCVPWIRERKKMKDERDDAKRKLKEIFA